MVKVQIARAVDSRDNEDCTVCTLCVYMLSYSLLKKKERQVSNGWSYRCFLMWQTKAQQGNRSTSPVSHPSHAVSSFLHCKPSKSSWIQFFCYSTIFVGVRGNLSEEHQLELHCSQDWFELPLARVAAVWWRGWEESWWRWRAGVGDSHQPAREVVVLEASTPG